MLTPEVAIVTDTTACIPPEQVEKYGIKVVPVDLIFRDKVYRDGVDITPTEFYNLLREAKELPTTSGSLPEPYLEAFQKAGRQVKTILCITLSANLSAMFNSALLAREMAKEGLPNVIIEILDCGTAAAGQGLVVLAAAQKAASGGNLDEVIATTRRVMSRVKIYAALDTLYYLVKGGRVPKAVALVNSVLKIKPIFTIEDGEAHTVALPRTTKNALKRIQKIVARKTGKGRQLHVAVMHADSQDRAISLRDQIASKFNCVELFITEFTPVMGVHTGPGLVGVAFWSED